jgi:hypothetical protein
MLPPRSPARHLAPNISVMRLYRFAPAPFVAYFGITMALPVVTMFVTAR